MSAKYDQFLVRVREIQHLGAAAALQGWDQEVFLPAGGVPARARHRATLAAVIHDKLCAEDLGDLAGSLAEETAGPVERANLREFRRQRDRAVKIPRDLVTELAATSSLAQQAWVQARRTDDWPHFAPLLSKLVDLKRREAEAVGYEGEPFDALLDEYEPGARCAELLPLFAELRQALVTLLGEIEASTQPPDPTPLEQAFPLDRQDAFGREVLADIGFDFTAGRLDTSAHPFTEGIAVRDVRITTHYAENHLGRGLYANLHEGGHALYEQGLPLEHEDTPVGAAVSLGIHESQSRLWENAVGRSREFWRHYTPRLAELFGDQLAGHDPEQLFRAANVVRPSLIRIEADEVTYNLHIILRLELERALLLREIEVEDLPGLWREKTRELLGLAVPSDAEGVLQDIHWAFGAFGYFPTYTLGNLYCAQFFAQACADLGVLPDQIACGEFGPLREWLRRQIHQRGSLLPAAELCREVTGRDLSITPFMDHLRGKFGDIYGF